MGKKKRKRKRRMEIRKRETTKKLKYTDFKGEGEASTLSSFYFNITRRKMHAQTDLTIG